MKMTDFELKEFLSVIRGKDYAHAGEEEAINLVFADISRLTGRRILDTGCGRGGTADFVQRNGWGKVVGIDIDDESIRYAQLIYPEVEFHVCDVVHAGEKFSQSFELIYLFNAFYAFQDRYAAMLSLRKAAASGARLCLFDYICSHSQVVLPEAGLRQKPPTLEECAAILHKSHWKLIKTENLDDKYIQWYRNFLDRLEILAQEKTYPPEIIAEFRRHYGDLLYCLEQRLIGGVFLEAVAN